MAIDMAYKENLSNFEPLGLYDQFSLLNYMDGGYKFKFEDV